MVHISNAAIALIVIFLILGVGGVLQCGIGIVWLVLIAIWNIFKWTGIGIWIVTKWVGIGIWKTSRKMGEVTSVSFATIARGGTWIWNAMTCTSTRQIDTNALATMIQPTATASTVYEAGPRTETGAESEAPSYHTAASIAESTPATLPPPPYQENADVTLPEPAYDPNWARSAAGDLPWVD